MPWLTDLADVCRQSGLAVIEVDGWRTRGHGAMTAVRGIVCHHTVGPATGDYPSLRTVRDGVPGVSGPLAQLGIGRSGTVYVVAAGVSYHAGRGSWPGLLGNNDCIGVEGESVGTRDDWTAAQRAAWPRLCGALAQHYRIPARLVIAHREWAPTRKIDPAYINMDQLRAAVAAWNPEDDMPLTEAEMVRIADLAAAKVWNFEIPERYGRGPAPAHIWLGDIASVGTEGMIAARAADKATAPMPAQIAAVGHTADDVQHTLATQAATIVATITAAIREATGGSIDHAIVEQAVHDAVSRLEITMPDDAA